MRTNTSVVSFLVALALAAIAAIFVVSINGCATIDPPKDNPNASSLATLAAAKYRQAAFDKVSALAFRSAYNESPNTACTALKAAAAISDRNRAKIDAYEESIESGDAVAAADWGTIIDLVLTGLEATSTVTEAEANAKAVLRADITTEELQSRYERASSNYEAALEMMDKARQTCG